MAWVKKALCCPNNGQDVFFADYDYRDDASLGPPIWFLKTPHFTLLEGASGLPLRTVAVFNLADEARDFALTPAKLRLPAGDYTITDVWSLETADLSRFAGFTLAGRRSRLFAVSPKTDQLQVLDANTKIDAVTATGKGLAIHFAHAGDLALVLSRKPRRLLLNGRRMKAEVARGKGNWLVKVRIPARAVIDVA